MNLDGAVWAIVGLIVGNLGTQATMGVKIATLASKIEELTRRVGVMESAPHYHRRATDDE